MRFRKFIANHVRALQFHDLGILLSLGVVTPQHTWNPFIPEEISTDITKGSFLLHSTDVEHVGTHAIKDLGTRETIHTGNIGEDGVCGHFLINPLTRKPFEARFEMPDHGKACDFIGKLCGLFEGLNCATD